MQFISCERQVTSLTAQKKEVLAVYPHAQITPRIFLKGVIFYVLELQRNVAY